jgi:hypothetical protein
MASGRAYSFVVKDLSVRWGAGHRLCPLWRSRVSQEWDARIMTGTKCRESVHECNLVHIVSDTANEDGPFRFRALFHVGERMYGVVRTILLFWITYLFADNDDGPKADSSGAQQAEQTIQTEVSPQAPVVRSRPAEATHHLVVCPD